jgi:hypothetical protein
LLADGQGIDGHFNRAGIEYEWLVELGNPQKTDPAMTILRYQLSQLEVPWPVNRGLARLHKLVLQPARLCALLCACKHYDHCHRQTIAEAFSQRFFVGKLKIRELT